MKIGIIGLGRVFDHYVSNFIDNKFLSENQILICDSNKQLLKKYSEKLNCKSFENIEKLIDEKPHFVIVASPSGLHYHHSKSCLQNNINVLSEKPACMSIKEHFDLIKLSQENNLKCGVIFQNRFNSAMKTLKKIIDENHLGKINICSMKLHWCRDQNYYSDDWHGTWNMDGGVINQQAIHHIDALQWINGPVKQVFSIESNLINNLEAEDTMMACIKFQNDSLGTIEATTAFRPKDYEASITISGDKGFVKVGGVAINQIIDYSLEDIDQEVIRLIEDSSEDFSSGYGNSHKKVIESFIDSLLLDQKFPIDILDTLNTTKLVHSLYRSSEKSMLVDVNNDDSMRLGK